MPACPFAASHIRVPYCRDIHQQRPLVPTLIAMSSTSNVTAGAAATDRSNSTGGANRNNRNNRHRGNNTHTQGVNHTVSSKFDGKCEGLKGLYYDCSKSKDAELFEKTTKGIGDYVGKEYACGSFIRSAIVKGLSAPKYPDKPTDLDPSSSSDTDKEIWKQKVRNYVRDEAVINEKVRSVYSLVLGQCTPAMEAKLRALPEWEDMQEEKNGLDLIIRIKKIAFHFEATRYDKHALYDAHHRFMLFKQESYMDSQTYHQSFQSHVEVIKHCGGSFGYDPVLLDSEAKKQFGGKRFKDISTVEQAKVAEIVEDSYLACAFIVKSDQSRYRSLLVDLENNFTKGQNVYPQTLNVAYNLLSHWKQDRVERTTAGGSTC